MKRGISSVVIGISIFVLVMAVGIIVAVISINNKNNDVDVNNSNYIDNSDISETSSDDSNDTIKYGNVELKIGDYVDYTPTNKTSTKYKKTYVRPGTDPYETQNDLKWRVIGINAGKLLLISEKPTEDLMYLQGSDGYLNGSKNLDELCKELYSSDKGVARNLNLNDVNQILKYTGTENGYDIETEEKYSYKPVYLEQPKTIGEIESEIGIKLSNRNTPDGKDISNYVANDCYYERDSDFVLASEVEKNIIFGTNDEFVYFLASNYIEATFDVDVRFMIHTIGSGGVIDGQPLYSQTTGEQPYWAAKMRPVIELNSDVEILEFKNNVWILK